MKNTAKKQRCKRELSAKPTEELYFMQFELLRFLCHGLHRATFFVSPECSLTHHHGLHNFIDKLKSAEEHILC